MAILFPEDDGTYAVFGKNYLPEKTVEEAGNDHYRGWAVTGSLTVTDGGMIDFGRIEDDILDLAREHEVAEVAYDPFQASMLVQRLSAAGISVIEYAQNVRNMSDPTKMLEGLINTHKLRHGFGPADTMTWMMSNVTGKLDAKDNIYPRKERPENKIDGPVALIAALGRSMAAEPKQAGSYLETSELLVL